ncbi:flavodoxin-dependent (E)-4-hydroxy-3-methylbut-2-enyl-diphosphate synthase [Desulfovibrio sp. OttesenSCG-928-C14]|nr:flavodoxin-dependent (E)-4-hydroxy-3-methylbut-2-enyl-diphosphate synthase [Desulfovibrio sp. OttesenSCG-928-C14]
MGGICAKAEKSALAGLRSGGGAPVSVQSMTNTDTRDAAATLAQIRALHQAGCEIVRLAVPDEAAALALREIRAASPLPLIADIHFSHKLALMALEAGVDGLRINPGNIGSAAAVDEVARAALERGAPIRIGVNSGSVEKDLLRKYGGPTPEAMAESALKHVALLEKRAFSAIKISLKSSSVPHTVAAYRILAAKCDYPLHIGITEAGTLLRGAVKSAVGLGILLAGGLGDTMRVSLTHDPVREVEVAWEILRSLGLRSRGPEIISCPTCGRTEIDLIGLAQAVEEKLRGLSEVFTLAVMGCVVNGPGEAREADLGLAGGRGKGVIFRKGERVRSVAGDTSALLEALLEEVESFLTERRGAGAAESESLAPSGSRGLAPFEPGRGSR